jgi:ATP phosphoribosyltransferase regulatory subunit HisZ
LLNFHFVPLGFDAHGGGSHPVMEGIVICQEFEQTLRDALEQQKQITIEKEIKKKEERVYKNWRKLIRGLIIKQNLARKYADDETEGGELATDAKYQWPVLPKEDKVNEDEFM